MKEAILSLIFLSISFVVVGQTKHLKWSKVEQTEYGKLTHYENSDGEPLDGHYKLALSGGDYDEIDFKNGKIDGINASYDWKGRKTSVSHFENGKMNGKSVTYHQNGEVSKESYWKMNKRVGTWKTYDRDGEIKSIKHYKNGKKNGKWVEYLEYKDMNLKTTVTKHYDMGDRTGTWQEVDEKGRTIWQKKFSADNDYVHKQYHRNGELKSLETYKDHDRHGVSEFYSKAGIKTRYLKYKNGIVIQRKTYFDNGNLAEEVSFENSKVEGPYKKYNSKGDTIVEGQYADGEKTGKWTYYNEAGEVEKRGLFKNNLKIGTWKEYNLKGDLIRETVYKNGFVESEKRYN